VQSKAKTVAEYVASLPEDRREAIEALRKVFRTHLDPVFEECMQYGMISYVVPHRVFPAGYHCDPKQPLPFAGLASQKGHLSVYLMGIYAPDGAQNSLFEWFRDAWLATGRKLDMGKCCIRFKRLEQVPLEVLGEALRRQPAKDYVEYYLSAMDARTKPAATKQAAPKKAASKKAAPQKTAPAAKRPAKAATSARQSKPAAKKKAAAKR
jgi:hypothetical protein